MMRRRYRPCFRSAKSCYPTLLLCLLCPLLVHGTRASGGDGSPSSPSARPIWLSEDQLIECATALADGLRSAPLILEADRPVVLRLPSVENRTQLPIPDPAAFARRLAGLINLRTGLRVSFEAGFSTGFRLASSGVREPYQARLFLAPAVKHEKNRVTMSLHLSEPGKRAAEPVAEYTFRPAAKPRKADRDRVGPQPAVEHGEYAERIDLDAGELRLASRKLARRLRLLADRTRRQPDGRLSVRLDVVAPDHAVKVKVRVEFLSADGRVIRTTETRRHRFRKGRTDTIHLESVVPVDSFVAYVDD